MAVSDAELIGAWMEVLTLSELKPGQCVTVLTNDTTNPQTLRCALTSLRLMGAMANRLDLPPVNAAKSLSRDSLAYLGATALAGNKAAIAALESSDLVLDLMTLLFSAEQLKILKGGTKILLAVEPPEVLVRMLPTQADRTRVKAAARRIAAAKEMHILSEAGTDLRCALGEFPVGEEYGFVDAPGRWDHWPSGFAFTFADEGSAQGRIVLDRGDILLPMKSYVAAPVAMTVERGYVTAIDGELDAELLIDYMASFDDPEAYAISHIGWGLQKKARWSTLGLYDREATIGMDARAFEGNFLFSLGPNNEAGGSRTCACHIDIPMRHCTVRLDGVDVVTVGYCSPEEPVPTK